MLDDITKNWKTTTLGLAGFVLVGYMVHSKVDTSTILTVMGGFLGLLGITSKDSNKT